MSRLGRSLGCFSLGGWLHFWQVWLVTILQNCRIVNPVSKLQFSYQTAASAAAPLPLFRTGWTIFANEVHCLAALLDVSAPYVQLLVCVQSGPQIFFNLLFPPRSTLPRLSFPSRSVHRFLLSLPSLLSCASFPSALTRSFQSSKTDRPSRTRGICRLQNCRSSSAAFLFRFFSSCVLRSLTPSDLAPKPKLSGASNKDASTPLSTRSRRDDRSSVESCSFFGGSSVPAGFLQRTFTRQTRPQFTDGAEDTENTAQGPSHAQQTRQDNPGVKELQSHEGGYNI